MFESLQGQGCVSLVSTVCVVRKRSLRPDQSSRGVLRTEVSFGCNREASLKRRPWPTGGCCAMETKIAAVYNYKIFHMCQFIAHWFNIASLLIQLTLWSSILLEKLIVPHLVKSFRAFVEPKISLL